MASAGVIKEEILHCGSNEVPCGDGRCVGLAAICDGVHDCSDGLDEGVCEPGFNSSLLYSDLVRRSKRQSNCLKTQWSCRDGTCIQFDKKCDGVVDCLDGSDETHPLCRHSPCQEYLFRCTYGACVDGDAACNNVQDCADNSDELLPRCRDEKKVVRGQFICDNGDQIRVTGLCDGVTDCADGSDETIRACAGKTCDAYLFQCAYGACVDNGSDCDNKIDCADGSDESDELCNRTSSIVPTRPTSTTERSTQTFVGQCKMPDFPQNGRYVVVGGDRRTSVGISVTCDPGFDLTGNPNLYCINGIGFENMPRCLRFCTVTPHRSVEYLCEIRNGNSITTRPCQEKELPGTIVRATCQPNYRFTGVANKMECKDGFWTHVTRCSPECGTITPSGKQYVLNGVRAKHGELPWHAGIYRKTTKPYKQICGGSLVTTTAVITAAHCFWDDVQKKLPAQNYAVALGKVYRPFNNKFDNYSQSSDVNEIHIPQEFRGASTHFQTDIAVLILQTAIQYETYIRPICVSFSPISDERQLSIGKRGKVAGWGLTNTGNASQVLLVVELPYVDYDQCYNESPEEFRAFLNADKFCAGYTNGTALCEGDSGGGLAFYDQGDERYYLRGIVSTAPNSNNKCDPFARTTFTRILRHEGFLRDYINDWE